MVKLPPITPRERGASAREEGGGLRNRVRWNRKWLQPQNISYHYGHCYCHCYCHCYLLLLRMLMLLLLLLPLLLLRPLLLLLLPLLITIACCGG